MTAQKAQRLAAVKLLMISHYFEEHRGGIEIVAGTLARELGCLDFVVTLLATGSCREDYEFSKSLRRAVAASNFAETLLKLPYPLLFPSAWRAIFREVRHADAVLVHDALYMTSIVGYLAARVYRKPFVVVQHIGLVPYRNLFLRKLMEAANQLLAVPILRRADKVIFISQITAQHFANIGWHRTPALVFSGVDTKIFSPPANDAEIESARRSLGLPLGVPIVLFVGRFVEKKGLPILERIARERPDIVFAFGGWGALNPSGWKLPNVRVFGSLSGASLASLYRASDLLSLPSVGEGFPLVVQEALACGLPIVCGLDTAAADSAAAPFLKGVAIDLGNPNLTAQLFCEQMARLLTNPNTATQRLKRFEFARARYSWVDTTEQYRKILHELAPHQARTT